MRVYLIFAVAFLALAAFASAESVKLDPSHTLEKRDTIYVDPPLPRCVFYECVGNCKQRGHSGGICTMTGCHCVG